MRKDSRQFLDSLLLTPSPSGYEQAIQRVVKRRVKDVADSIEIDIHGNLIAALNTDAPIKVMLAGHCDQIGLMVTHIDDSGYISFGEIGGIDPSVLPGTLLQIHTRKGIVEGVIGHKAVHLIPAAERGKAVEIRKLWIDIGARDGKEAKSKVKVGDPITYHLKVTDLGESRIATPACDDKVGVFVVMEAFRLIAASLKKKSSPVAVYAVSTVQEELGLRGAKTSSFGIDPLVGIAVDVTHASDNPGADAKEIGTVKLGEGPTIARGPNINPVLGDLLEQTAEKKKLAYQPLSSPRATGTDANAIQINRSGVAAALIGIPNRYMHTQVEVVDLRDLETAAKLLAETVLAITKRTSFIPS